MQKEYALATSGLSVLCENSTSGRHLTKCGQPMNAVETALLRVTASDSREQEHA